MPVRLAPVVQTQPVQPMARASSTSIPRYLTVLSIFDEYRFGTSKECVPKKCLGIPAQPGSPIDRRAIEMFARGRGAARDGLAGGAKPVGPQ